MFSPENPSPITDPIVIGVDVGSTTVKATVVDPSTNAILWSEYRRHNTRQPESVFEFLTRIGLSFPAVPQSSIRIFMTGSGAGPIAPHVGARFVQEVNAVTMAVEALHPDAGSVIELGGQDAKIIMFKENGKTGEKIATTSMNDKCASGTGATIDKCMIKVGMEAEDVAKLRFDPTKIHHVAAKCGVFAETDIVNLVKSGVPSEEIMCSLADAIVLQNLSVLTRGNTLKPKVILLGGPNTYLPFLKECWLKRIPESWVNRDFDYPKDVPIEELIFAPDNSLYYAAFGAVIYGVHEPAEIGCYTGLDGLRSFIENGRQARLAELAGPPLVQTTEELDDFREMYRVPSFDSARFEPGEHVQAVIGLDGGSTSSKCVLVDQKGRILKKEYVLSKGNPIADMKSMLASLKAYVVDQGATLEILGFGATGYAADVLETSCHADVNIVETIAHTMSAKHYFGDVDVICDIGGQDIKVLFMKDGEVRNFRLSNQCSAGNGMLLQAMADQFGVDVKDYAGHAFEAGLSPTFSYGCAVFLDSDRVNFQKEGFQRDELLAGLAMVLPKNIWQYVVQVPRMATLGSKFVLQGGTQHNLAAVKAQVDYIMERVPGAEVYVHPHTGEAGAIGAAMETLRVVQRKGRSTFIGLDAAIALEFTTLTDETTRCDFCPNLCSRTFIDTSTPDGATSRYISGFSCEKGTVESYDELKRLNAERSRLKKSYPNLVDLESTLAFKSFFTPDDAPAHGTPIEDVEVSRGMFGKLKRKTVQRGFERSSAEAAKRRKSIRVGIPRVLNIWSSAPIWRTYLESLGIQSKNVVFSDFTSEEMWVEGGRYGSVDPCYPSKVAQAHVHNLLFHKHSEDNPLSYMFFPSITHVTSPIVKVMDTTSCPIVAGCPNMMKAAFTKEVDFFATRGIEFVDPAIALTEVNMLKEQMFAAFGARLEVTRDENDFAVDQAMLALAEYDRRMEARGKEILDECERDDRLALLMIGRPYHSDPGINHAILDEFQVLGFPILSMRSIPKDREYLMRFFADDIEKGLIEDPLEINDVWPENYSANSVMKVWCAKFAARHPNVAVLDLSNFKCGNDAPTFGLVDSIVSASGTAYAALHDIDANKPTGSIKIRTKTYAHTLGLHEERMEDLREKKAELAYRIDEKRIALLEMKREQLRTMYGRLDPVIEAKVAAAQARMASYERAHRADFADVPPARAPALIQIGSLRDKPNTGSASLPSAQPEQTTPASQG